METVPKGTNPAQDLGLRMYMNAGTKDVFIQLVFYLPDGLLLARSEVFEELVKGWVMGETNYLNRGDCHLQSCKIHRRIPTKYDYFYSQRPPSVTCTSRWFIP